VSLTYYLFFFFLNIYSSNGRADVMMLGPTEPNRSSLRGKTFGERALPGKREKERVSGRMLEEREKERISFLMDTRTGERLGEYRSSVGRGLPLRLGNNANCGPPHHPHSLPGTPVDTFPQGLKLPEPGIYKDFTYTLLPKVGYLFFFSSVFQHRPVY
jgi:hypothetical protein